MTDLLHRLRQLDAEATPGPWKATKNAYGCNFVQRWEPGTDHSIVCGGNNHDTLGAADAELIAFLRNHLPQIIAALERVEGESA